MYINLVEKNVDYILIYHMVHTKLLYNFKMYSIIIIIYLLISNFIKHSSYYKHCVYSSVWHNIVITIVIVGQFHHLVY